MNLQEAIKEISNGRIVKREKCFGLSIFLYEEEIRALNVKSLRMVHGSENDFEIKQIRQDGTCERGIGNMKYPKEKILAQLIENIKHSQNDRLRLEEDDILATDWEIFE